MEKNDTSQATQMTIKNPYMQSRGTNQTIPNAVLEHPTSIFSIEKQI
jgi:hypothetical protein